MKKLLMIFVDGLGLGAHDIINNPLAGSATPYLSKLLEGGRLTEEWSGFHGETLSLGSLDSTLGVPGLPQSATGQTSLFTGENAPQKLGYHLNGFPNAPLQEMLRENNILGQLKQKGLGVSFLNAYRPSFFSKHLPRRLPSRYSCSTLMTYFAGAKFRTLQDLQEGRAVYMDITNQLLRQMGYEVDSITPAEAAKRLVHLSQQYRFSLFEYFLTDIVGHQKDQEKASHIISTLDQLIGHIIQQINLQETLVLLTSDHGNLEELNHGRHTRNPVPLLLAGDAQWRSIALKSVDSLLGIVSFIKSYFATEA